MRRIILIIVFLFTYSNSLRAQNPIVPAGVYIADPSAHQWGDGKLYVYGSRDESPNYYCSWSYDVLSSSDLKQWEIHENAFSSRGPGDQVSYSDRPLYAPDCQYKNGTYYLYYCLATNQQTEGVAFSKSPVGPFINGTDINLFGYNQIDPSVFIDDDGQAYYVWGQFTAKIARMKPNMVAIDSASIIDDVLTEKEHFFHEGGYLIKRNNLYYLIYAHMGRAGKPTCIGYATSPDPMGPYRYGGVIIDNDHCDPGVWNNHGSIVEFDDQWYVFYHRSTHNSRMMRKACLEPIYFNSDGSIDEVEMTSQGAGGPLPATQKIEAERACLLYGNVRIQAFSTNEEALSGVNDQDAAAYKFIDFEKKPSKAVFRVAPGAFASKIDIALGQSWGKSIGTLDVAGGGDGKSWQTISTEVNLPSGEYAVWLRFSGQGEDLVNLDWFYFE
ncbi:MAG: family 43 glycosylhydrolase [Candidatus Cyclobacteriaceae bacterium M3_2C_046]